MFHTLCTVLTTINEMEDGPLPLSPFHMAFPRWTWIQDRLTGYGYVTTTSETITLTDAGRVVAETIEKRLANNQRRGN